MIAHADCEATSPAAIDLSGPVAMVIASTFDAQKIRSNSYDRSRHRVASIAADPDPLAHCLRNQLKHSLNWHAL